MANPPDGDVVLLGAGASKGAGLPISIELTRKISKRIHDGPPGFQWFTLNLVIGAMQAYRARSGIAVDDGIDVESVFSAVRSLEKRGESELAPFVTGWVTGVESINSQPRGLPTNFGRDLASAFETERSSQRPNARKIEEAFKKGVLGLTERTDLTHRVYSNLQVSMLAALHSELEISKPENFDYLRPLFQARSRGRCRIATLNYDLGVETAAGRGGVSLDTGRARWRGNYNWSFDREAQVQLLKMHGSLGWRTVRGWESATTDEGERIVESGDVTEDVQKSQFARGKPTLVFGRGSKLTADGPCLGMLLEFSKWLNTAKRLMVIGYSFGDDHINAVIEQWKVSHPRAQLLVINPAVKDWRPYSNLDPTPFTSALAAESWAETHNPDRPPSTVFLDERNAEDVLATLFTGG